MDPDVEQRLGDGFDPELAGYKPLVIEERALLFYRWRIGKTSCVFSTTAIRRSDKEAARQWPDPVRATTRPD